MKLVLLLLAVCNAVHVPDGCVLNKATRALKCTMIPDTIPKLYLKELSIDQCVLEADWSDFRANVTKYNNVETWRINFCVS